MSNIEILHFIWLIIFTIICEWTVFLLLDTCNICGYRMFSSNTKRKIFADHPAIIYPMTSCVTFVNIYLTINQNWCVQKHQNTRCVCVYAIRVYITYNNLLPHFLCMIRSLRYIIYTHAQCTIKAVAIFNCFFLSQNSFNITKNFERRFYCFQNTTCNRYFSPRKVR